MRRRIQVFGIVQGVGFRPFAVRTARKHHIRGTVSNHGSYVEILAEGEKDDVEAFTDDICHRPPERAHILKSIIKEEEGGPAFSSFEIMESRSRLSDIFVSPDIAFCDSCRRELLDPSNRRYHHPYINCTQCGPRLTILESVPYDRERTSMKMFPMCRTCHDEYTDPASRRYDAQPICCNDCGPKVYLAGEPDVRGDAAITKTRRVLAGGGIAAVKGVGGFHLVCDATNAQAVTALRRRKLRPTKPFAVMTKDLETAKREVRMKEGAEALLTGWQKPIVLLPRKEGGRICSETAPGCPNLGIFLPYAPIQCLLFDFDDGIRMPDCLVMTSGNTSGAPICRDDAEAKEMIAPFCDVILSGERPILTRCDDSVTDLYEGAPYLIRRSRGYAPLPFFCEKILQGRPNMPQVLAIGGELKNTFCLGKGELFYPSSYIGDLGDARSKAVLRETIERYLVLFDVKPSRIVCDLHPGYQSTSLAKELSQKKNIPLLFVQHHYAHILSCLAENDFDGKVLGVSYDGTGYGTDGTVWGGEILTADKDGFARSGSIEPFVLPGADVAAREGWRCAVSILLDQGDHGSSLIRKLRLVKNDLIHLVRAMKRSGLNCIETTSCGRLFDAAASVLCIAQHSTYEGEAASLLMYAAMRSKKPRGRVLEKTVFASMDGRYLLPTGKLIVTLAEKKLRGEETDDIALYFHEALADMTVDLLIRLGEETGIHTAALSGGCFQNLLLLDLVKKQLEENGFTVLIQRLVPPNDGGIALGQALFGACHGDESS